MLSLDNSAIQYHVDGRIGTRIVLGHLNYLTLRDLDNLNLLRFQQLCDLFFGQSFEKREIVHILPEVLVKLLGILNLIL